MYVYLPCEIQCSSNDLEYWVSQATDADLAVRSEVSLELPAVRSLSTAGRQPGRPVRRQLRMAAQEVQLRAVGLPGEPHLPDRQATGL